MRYIKYDPATETYTVQLTLKEVMALQQLEPTTVMEERLRDDARDLPAPDMT